MNTDRFATSENTVDALLRADRNRWMARARPDFLIGLALMSMVLVVLVLVHFGAQGSLAPSGSMLKALGAGLVLCVAMAAVSTAFMMGPWPTQRAMTTDVERYRMRMLKADAQVREMSSNLKLFCAATRRIDRDDGATRF